jgi:transposase
MLGPRKERRAERLVPISLEAAVPADHFYRHLEAVLDLGFVREWAAGRYAEGGRPGIDPVVFFKLQLVMFFEGVRSERQLLRIVADRLSVRWYLGYDLDEPLPDHSSLTRIRERLGLPIFQRFFAHVVELCRDAGLVWGRELFFDATKVRANAAIDSLVPRWYAEAKAHLDDVFGDQPGNLPDEPNEGEAPARLPFAGPPAAEQQCAEANRVTWRLLDQLRLDPARPATRGHPRTTDLRVSTTDADAAPMRAYRGQRTRLGYHDHYVVDGGRARIILAALVTPADVMENQAMLDLLRRVRFRWHLHPKRAVGDTTYGTVENIRALEEMGIRAYVPLPDFDERTPYFGASHFVYDADRDEYRCPRGHPLHRVKAKYTEEMIVYQAAATACNACPLKARCTASVRGRQVYRSFHADYLDRVRGYHATAAYQKAMRKRAVWVEPLFGEAKDWHGLRKFRLRRLWKVNCAGLLIAAGQNLKRWLSRTGWGRRHGPAGRLALSPAAPGVWS